MGDESTQDLDLVSHSNDGNDSGSNDSNDGDAHLNWSQPETWAIGDRCLVKWSVDKQKYPAKIKKFRKTSLETWALVSFRGFDSEDDEWVETRKLLRRPQKRRRQIDEDVIVIEDPNKELQSTLFAPLKGNEEQSRIAEKFRHLDEDVTPSCSNFETKKWPTTSKKLVDDISQSTPVRSTGRVKKELNITGGKTKNSTPKLQKLPTQTSVRNLDTLDITNSSEASDDGCSGFSSEELEKPYFPKTQTSETCPLVLSEAGVKPEVMVAVTINRYLRDYQRDGVRFLYKHYVSGHGALLADDMGLGKTVQVIAFIAAILSKTGTKADILAQRPSFIRKLSENADRVSETPKCPPILVIGPASVLYNWIDEFETWGYFNVGKYHKHYKAETLSDARRGKLDVVVTTYETCRDNVDELNSIKWEAVFADEVHKIKGLKAEVTKALRKLKCLKRFGLSGTPLQNNVKELWSLLDWCYPNCLGNFKEFNSKCGRVIENGQKHNATKRQLAEARKAQGQLAELRDKWMLRRTKSLIQDQMPQKSEMVVYCRPTTLQVSVYKAIFDLEWMDYVLKQKEPCTCSSGTTRGKCCYRKLPLPPPDDKSIRAITMSYMHLLLKAANHIALLLPSHTNNENQKKEAEKICRTVFSGHPQFIRQTKEAAFKTLSDPKFCGKMKILQGMLSVFKKQRAKVLIFSYSTRLLDILETYVMSMGYEYQRLDGRTKESARVQLVKQFNKDPNLFLFLISTRAGGVGLNLTGANVVIIFDPNWNPTHDLQAQDRAYRIGQRRDVKVYRLITSGTIEENIYLRQVHKQQLGEVAVSAKNSKRLFHANELFGIESTFHFRMGDRCLTEDILNRQSKVEDGMKPKVQPGMEDFDIERYVPAGEEVPEHNQEENEEEEEEDDKDSDVTNFGLNYICTQLMDMEPQGTDEVATSQNPEIPQGYENSESQVVGHTQTKSNKLVELGVFENQTKSSTAGMKRNNSEVEGSMDDFLDDLFDIGAPPSKLLKHSPKKNVVGCAKISSKAPKIIPDPADLWDELESMGNSDSEQVFGTSTEKYSQVKSKLIRSGTKYPARAEKDVMGKLWDEMESVNNTEDDRIKTEELNSDKSQNEVDLMRSKDKEVKSKAGKSKVRKKNTSKASEDADIDDLFNELEHQSSSDDDTSEHDVTVKQKFQSASQKTRSVPEKFSGNGSKGVKTALKKVPSKSSLKRTESKKDDNLSQDDDNAEFTLLGGGTMECDFDSDLDDKPRSRKKSKRSSRQKKTVRISESKNQVHENDMEIGEECNVTSQSAMDCTFESVTDVFALGNVVHMHQNRKVTGSSRAEDHMSRCAIKDVYELNANTQAPAILCARRSSSSPEESPKVKTSQRKSQPRKKKASVKKTSHGKKLENNVGFFHGPRSVTDGKNKVLIGQTPKSVRRHQFGKLVKHIQSTSDPDHILDPVRFAKDLLQRSRKKHVHYLQEYYTDPSQGLAHLIQDQSVNPS